MPRGANHTTDRARIDWLLAHQALWTGYGTRQDARTQAIVEAMQREGLYSPRTLWYDIDLPGMIILARRVRREKAAGESTADPASLDVCGVA